MPYDVGLLCYNTTSNNADLNPSKKYLHCSLVLICIIKNLTVFAHEFVRNFWSWPVVMPYCLFQGSL